MKQLLTILLFLTIGFPVLAQAESKKIDNVNNVILETVFNEAEKVIIEDYFGKKKVGENDKDKAEEKDKDNKGKSKAKGKSKKDGPGPAKKGALPPGLQMQLEKNGRLPPGLEKRALPPGLAGKLPPRKNGTERVIVENDVVLLEAETGLVLDVIKDVVSNF
jgi:hypothetical protein